MSGWNRLIAAVSALPAGDELGPGGRIAAAALLLATALVLLVLEFFIVSHGLIAALAALAAVAAIVYAFTAGPLVGWLFVAATPVLAIAVASWGLRRLQRSRLVVQAEIAADAGYRHAADAAGVAAGARGTLVTAAYPTGRARFPGGEIDVVVRGEIVGKGAAIVVTAIEGPTVYVRAAQPPS